MFQADQEVPRQVNRTVQRKRRRLPLRKSVIIIWQSRTQCVSLLRGLMTLIQRVGFTFPNVKYTLCTRTKKKNPLSNFSCRLQFKVDSYRIGIRCLQIASLHPCRLLFYPQCGWRRNCCAPAWRPPQAYCHTPSEIHLSPCNYRAG